MQFQIGGFLATFPHIVYNKSRKTCSFFMGRVRIRKGKENGFKFKFDADGK